ncbi:hypothetical protein OJAV_G00203610 [Oryzias javanicus]|uniref:Nuclear receptor subfamily 1 group I member 2 n=1 Tax=Oryzias javanicus TaxID=123683 RepID=A0A437C5K3_ORYJA|nr:hypothetical protein OJAV_G00203610 [Oryzias javanicus]
MTLVGSARRDFRTEPAVNTLSQHLESTARMTRKDASMQTDFEELNMQNEDDEDEDGKVTEDEEPKACGVCGDLAKGYHFNALTCEGCKGFFRRAIKRSSELQCPFLNNCIITKSNRRSCQACRFQKCQAIGMRKEMVMSEEEVLQRRTRIRRRKMHLASEQISLQQEQLIQDLVRGHRNTFDSGFSRFTGFRPMDRDLLEDHEHESHLVTSCPFFGQSKSEPAAPTHSFSCSSSGLCESSETLEDPTSEEKGFIFTFLPHLVDLSTYMIQDVIRFSKSLQDFRTVIIEDQISLLKGAAFEMMQIRFNIVFDTATNQWKCGSIIYCIHDAFRAGFQPFLLDPLFKFHHTLRKLDLQEEEYALIQALSLFSPDRPGVQEHQVIDKIHEKLALALKTWIDCKRTDPGKHLLYPKIIACLTELRSMTEEYSKQILQIQDIQPDTISPLLMEVVSKNPCNDF